MNYSKKDIVIGFIIIFIIFGSMYLFKNYRSKKVEIQGTPAPVSITYKNDFEKKFKYTIPEGVNSIELKDISGGDGMGLATDNEILADIKDPDSGSFYQAWLESNNGKVVLLGNLNISKGGWMIVYDKSKMPEAQKIIVSLEKRNDSIIETKILEGSFK
jgi:hypothetical protein